MNSWSLNQSHVSVILMNLFLSSLVDYTIVLIMIESIVCDFIRKECYLFSFSSSSQCKTRCFSSDIIIIIQFSFRFKEFNSSYFVDFQGESFNDIENVPPHFAQSIIFFTIDSIG